MTSSSNTTGIHNLPVPGSRSAPKKFKGRFSSVKPFIKHYEKLCTQKGVTDDEEKIQNCTQYCSRKVREFLEGLPTYVNKNWEAFVQDINEYYDAERDSKRFKRGDLEAFCRHAKADKTHMKLSYWKEYNRDFIRIAGWLEGKRKISSEEKCFYFWKGIPIEFRDKLEARLLATKPNHDLETPFKIEDVNKVAKTFLQRNRFDLDRVNSDSEFESSESEADSSDSSNSGSESDTDKSPRKSSKSKHSSEHKKKKIPLASVGTSPNSRGKKDTKIPEKKAKEVEDLIQQMSKLSLHDPTYAVLYYRAYQIDPFVSEILQKPMDRQQTSRNVLHKQSENSRNVFSNNRANNNAESPSESRQAPPHMDLKPGSNVYRQPQEPRRCFGCGNSGHTTFNCEEMAKLEKEGLVRKNETGRYIMADGSMIRRTTFDEPLVVAAKRMTPAQVNYVVLEHREKDLMGLESDAEEEDVFVVTRSQNAKREKIGQRRNRNSAEKIPIPLKRRRIEINHPQAAGQDSEEGEEDEEDLLVPKVPTPITIDDTVFNPQHDDELMEEARLPQNTEKHKQPAIKRKQRRSEIQEQIDLTEILTRIMNQPTTLTLRELMGTSKDLADHLREALRPKAVEKPVRVETNLAAKTPDPMVAAALVPRAREMLIRLEMECKGRPVTAIVDTGSQVNIAHSRIWKDILQSPLGKENAINMNDANGGSGKLKGLVSKLKLNCGEVQTKACVYVGDNVPFDLLLGRPWQRGNQVSIDERKDGTYLIFKDKDFKETHELRVVPEEYDPYDPEVFDFMSQIRRGVVDVNAVFVDDEDSKGTKEAGLGGSIPIEVHSVIDPENRGAKSPEDSEISHRCQIPDTAISQSSENPPGLHIPWSSEEKLNLEERWRNSAMNLKVQALNSDLAARVEPQPEQVGETNADLNWELQQVLAIPSAKAWREKSGRPKPTYSPLAVTKAHQKGKDRPLPRRVIDKRRNKPRKSRERKSRSPVPPVAPNREAQIERETNKFIEYISQQIAGRQEKPLY